MLTEQMSGWELAIERGSLFHHWIHQDSVGIDLKDSVRVEDDPILQRWWQNWHVNTLILPQGVVYSEMQLSGPILDYRLVAQFDRLIVAENRHLYIADWKTGSRAPNQTVYEAIGKRESIDL